MALSEVGGEILARKLTFEPRTHVRSQKWWHVSASPSIPSGQGEKERRTAQEL